MVTVLAQDVVIDVLAAQYAAISDLLAELPDSDWSAATPCPGWDVQAAVAHMVGTELSLSGVELPPELPPSWPTAHLQNDVGRANERWIAALAAVSPAEIAARFSDITSRRIETLRALDNQAWTAVGFTPAGQDSYGRFMRIRVFDCWMHEQDIRDAVGRPGHDGGSEVDVSLDEVATALGFVVGKKAHAPAGSSVCFDLTGPSGRRIAVSVAQRAQVVDELDGPPTVTLRLPVGTFTRLCGGRISAANDVQIDGDAELGHRIVDNLSYTI